MALKNDWLLWGLLGLLLLGGGTAAVVYYNSRGLRNNNPGNIRLSSTVWEGQVSPDQQTDTEFVQFTDPIYGIRAMARIIKNYMARGVVTLSGIIATWAPPSENDTEAYTQSVSDMTGISPLEILDTGSIPGIVEGIIQHENGQQPYTAAQISQGVSLA